MRILLAVDDSPKSELAIEEMLRLNIPKGSTLRVITAVELPVIIPPVPLNPSMARVGVVLESLRNQAHLRLQKTVGKLREKLSLEQCEIEADVLLGSPAQAVVEDAERWRADLLVIGSHLYSTWERWLLGSDSMAIAQAAPCDIYIARQQSEDFSTVR